MVILKVESKGYKHAVAMWSLHSINTLIRAVEKECFAKIDFGETLHLNGSNQRIDHIQRPPGLRMLVALTLSFQNHHHLSLYLSVGPSTQLCREARFLDFLGSQNLVLNRHEVSA